MPSTARRFLLPPCHVVRPHGVRAGRWLSWALAACAALGGMPVQGHYKVIGPDRRVTYTDRPPAGAAPARTLASAPTEAGPALPYELSQVVSRYPVTLFTLDGCAPCAAARQALRERGVPHREVTVRNQDLTELMRREGARDVPILKIGAQQLVGWAPAEWQRYLDAAGYPRTSALPPGWRWPAPQPLVPTAAPAAAAAEATAVMPGPPPSLPPSPPPPRGAASGFRF